MANKGSVQTAIEEQGTAPRPVPKTRDELRAEVFKSRAPKSKVIPFFGVDIELRQPKLGDIVAIREGDDAENKVAVIDYLVKYAFVPDTNEHLFEETDAESFKAQPWGSDFTRVIETIQELTGINFSKRGQS